MFLKNFFFVDNILKILGKRFINKVVFFKNDVIIYLNLKNFFFVINFLKNHENTQYKVLADLTCVDYPSDFLRFNLIYNLLTIKYNHRILLVLSINEIISVSSLNSLYKSSNWLEREVWDMFGVFFFNHPDMRRILTDYGFKGFPLRKDFPLTGYLEVRYDEEKKRIIYEALETSQEFRLFNFISPWEQLYNLKIGK